MFNLDFYFMGTCKGRPVEEGMDEICGLDLLTRSALQIIGLKKS